jgi:hypothetical protein
MCLYNSQTASTSCYSKLTIKKCATDTWLCWRWRGEGGQHGHTPRPRRRWAPVYIYIYMYMLTYWKTFSPDFRSFSLTERKEVRCTVKLAELLWSCTLTWDLWHYCGWFSFCFKNFIDRIELRDLAKRKKTRWVAQNNPESPKLVSNLHLW